MIPPRIPNRYDDDEQRMKRLEAQDDDSPARWGVIFVAGCLVLATFAPERRNEQGPLYLFSNNGIFGPAFGSVALGLADTSLGDIIDFAAGKVPRGMEHSIRENTTVQAGVATAQARLGAARAYLHQTLSEVWQSVAREGGASHIERRSGMRVQ